MTIRKKKRVISGVTREAADTAFASFAKADAGINKIQADIELQCAKIREKWQDKLTLLRTERDTAFETLQAFATENHAELFAKKKSLEMAHGVIGFRTGTPKLKLLKGFTWASVEELVKVFLPDYVREKTEVAKDRLLADRNMEDVGVTDSLVIVEMPMIDAMAKCGLQVVQDETFFVEPKSETAED